MLQSSVRCDLHAASFLLPRIRQHSTELHIAVITTLPQASLEAQLEATITRDQIHAHSAASRATPITLTCTVGRILRIADKHAGRRVNCPAFQGILTTASAAPTPST